jgi:hypothetical protein
LDRPEDRSASARGDALRCPFGTGVEID